MKLRALLFVPLIVYVPTTAKGQDDLSSPRQVFNGEIAAGSWLRIRSNHGDIQVREGSGRNAVVTAVRGSRSGRPVDEVRLEVKRDGSNVTVCAIYPSTTRCDANGYSSSWSRGDSRQGSIDFSVTLPRGVRLVAATGNGDVEVRNAGAEVKASSGNGEVSVLGANGRVAASTGNGDVEVDQARGEVDVSSGNGDIAVGTTMGPVSATTGNGRIKVRMTSLTAPGDMEFSTGNGSVDITLPGNLSADIVANVSLRNFETDFPIQLPGRFSGNRVEGKIGGGGRRIRISTGNGRVSLRKT